MRKSHVINNNSSENSMFTTSSYFWVKSGSMDLKITEQPEIYVIDFFPTIHALGLVKIVTPFTKFTNSLI
jgi:hypothetical protein